jgi:hypothetical protein
MDRRRYPRFWVSQAVSLYVLKNETRVEARIQDISRNGVGVFVAVPILAGEVVELHSERLSMLAEVRHLRQGDDGYILGLEFCHEILKSEIDSVRTQQPTPPEPSPSYLEKLARPKSSRPGEEQ